MMALEGGSAFLCSNNSADLHAFGAGGGTEGARAIGILLPSTIVALSTSVAATANNTLRFRFSYLSGALDSEWAFDAVGIAYGGGPLEQRRYVEIINNNNNKNSSLRYDRRFVPFGVRVAEAPVVVAGRSFHSHGDGATALLTEHKKDEASAPLHEKSDQLYDTNGNNRAPNPDPNKSHRRRRARRLPAATSPGAADGLLTGEISRILSLLFSSAAVGATPAAPVVEQALAASNGAGMVSSGTDTLLWAPDAHGSDPLPSLSAAPLATKAVRNIPRLIFAADGGRCVTDRNTVDMRDCRDCAGIAANVSMWTLNGAAITYDDNTIIASPFAFTADVGHVAPIAIGSSADTGSDPQRPIVRPPVIHYQYNKGLHAVRRNRCTVRHAAADVAANDLGVSTMVEVAATNFFSAGGSATVVDDNALLIEGDRGRFAASTMVGGLSAATGVLLWTPDVFGSLVATDANVDPDYLCREERPPNGYYYYSCDGYCTTAPAAGSDMGSSGAPVLFYYACDGPPPNTANYCLGRDGADALIQYECGAPPLPARLDIARYVAEASAHPVLSQCTATNPVTNEAYYYRCREKDATAPGDAEEALEEMGGAGVRRGGECRVATNKATVAIPPSTQTSHFSSAAQHRFVCDDPLAALFPDPLGSPFIRDNAFVANSTFSVSRNAFAVQYIFSAAFGPADVEAAARRFEPESLLFPGVMLLSFSFVSREASAGYVFGGAPLRIMDGGGTFISAVRHDADVSTFRVARNTVGASATVEKMGIVQVTASLRGGGRLEFTDNVMRGVLHTTVADTDVSTFNYIALDLASGQSTAIIRNNSLRLLASASTVNIALLTLYMGISGNHTPLRCRQLCGLGGD